MSKIGLIGASTRVGAFVKILKSKFSGKHTIAGIMDCDPGKMKGFCEVHELQVPCYTDFDLFCKEVAPDTVIISTVDATHAEYVVKCLDRKISCIVEKPLCISLEQCREITEAVKRNPEVFAATSHNARYYPAFQLMKKMISEGAIGKILRVEYTDMLDREHGTSYFRRWNSRRKYSNGLELHKSSHHFDRLNYLLGSYAVEVTADGTRTVYGADAPHKFQGIHCHDCRHKDECPDFFAYDKKMFQSDMYTPDMCIYSPDIDIEDNFAAVIRFANGVLGTYSLCAHTQYEGEIIIVEGETGRLEMRKSYCRKANEVSNVHGDDLIMDNSLKLIRFRSGGAEEIIIPKAFGSHGGADDAIMSSLFADERPDDLPTIFDGMQAVLTGCAVVESIKTGRKVAVQPDFLS